MESSRQFIPRGEGDQELTNSEQSAKEDLHEKNKSLSSLKRMAGIAALATATLLHPETVEGQNKDNQKIESIEKKTIEQRTMELQGWLTSLMGRFPQLKGAELAYNARASGFSVANNQFANESYDIILSGNGKDVSISAPEGGSGFDIISFSQAVEHALGLSDKANSDKQKLEILPSIPDETIHKWFDQFKIL